MSVTDDLIFLRTGDESSSFVLVEMFKQGGETRARASLQHPEAAEDSEGRRYTGQDEGEPKAVISEAKEFALMNGYDLRVELRDVEWPQGLGTLITPPTES